MFGTQATRPQASLIPTPQLRALRGAGFLRLAEERSGMHRPLVDPELGVQIPKGHEAERLAVASP